MLTVTGNTPPSLFTGSKYPRFLAGRTEMAEILDQYNISHRTYNFEDAPHSFRLFTPCFEPTVQQMLAFLAQTL